MTAIGDPGPARLFIKAGSYYYLRRFCEERLEDKENGYLAKAILLRLTGPGHWVEWPVDLAEPLAELIRADPKHKTSVEAMFVAKAIEDAVEKAKAKGLKELGL